MRVAFSGSHRTGKTSLIEALAASLPGYRVVDEPYALIEDDGYEFSDPPTVEDFERQLAQSVESIADAPANALLDRCPLDFVAYLQAIDDDATPELDELRDSLALLDLVVIVPIEEPDRIAVPAHEDRRLRRRMDQRLRALVLDDSHALDLTIVEVTGSIDDRVRQVRRAMQRG